MLGLSLRVPALEVPPQLHERKAQLEMTDAMLSFGPCYREHINIAGIYNAPKVENIARSVKSKKTKDEKRYEVTLHSGTEHSR